LLIFDNSKIGEAIKFYNVILRSRQYYLFFIPVTNQQQ
jgi:hypothetical protein